MSKKDQERIPDVDDVDEYEQEPDEPNTVLEILRARLNDDAIEAIGGVDFSVWMSTEDEYLWSVWERFRNDLNQSYLDKCRYVDFLRFVADFTSWAPNKSQPLIPVKVKPHPSI
jgi:hypothetical protein